MPLTDEQKAGSQHYQALLERDEIIYNALYDADLLTFQNNGGINEDSLRDTNDSIQLYENVETGEAKNSTNQILRVTLFQRRYRTNAEAKDILNREFKEF
ncbi:MAG: hypothetical protein CMB80_25065 [Flammeovirgaceae bacterium]|nr:hypothetical protein [Flammeovirgaceae bacterium]|tara:strand:- start:2237 stop:2536 length:300 start_codon:yes stop_codon:yes gene_type:complete